MALVFLSMISGQKRGQLGERFRAGVAQIALDGARQNLLQSFLPAGRDQLESAVQLAVQAKRKPDLAATLVCGLCCRGCVGAGLRSWRGSDRGLRVCAGTGHRILQAHHLGRRRVAPRCGALADHVVAAEASGFQDYLTVPARMPGCRLP